LRFHATRIGWTPSEIDRAVSSPGKSLPQIDFEAEQETCSICGANMKVQKTQTRTIATLAEGVFQAREVLKECSENKSHPVVGSRKLQEIVNAHQRYAYDVIVHVGLARYLRVKQRVEIQAELRNEFGIGLSAGTVSNLCDRFLASLESLHVKRAPDLKAAMEGGYTLHVDATCERGKGATLVCLDGWRGWVLAASRIPSENADSVRRLVNKTVDLFGDPVGTMRDLSDAMAKAIEPLSERGIVDLACHYHFVSAVGTKLFDSPYSKLRTILRTAGIKKALRTLHRELRHYITTSNYEGRFGVGEVRENLLALVLWILEGDGKKELTFPFGLPLLSFVRRCRQVHQRIDCWMSPPKTQVERRALHHLKKVICNMEERLTCSNSVEALEQAIEPFSELRALMRLSNVHLLRTKSCGYQATFPSAEILLLEKIEADLKDYIVDLQIKVPTVGKKVSNPHPCAVILSYLKRYGSKLFGHPVRLDDTGTVLAVMERTNNVAEHFFARGSQRLRRRLGRKHIGHDLEQQPAQALLTANLLHPDYVSILCGSLENLPRAFAQVDSPNDLSSPLDRTNRYAKTFKLVRILLQHSEDTDGAVKPIPGFIPGQTQTADIINPTIS